MNRNLIVISCAALLTLLSLQPKASVIYSFDVSDVSWTPYVIGDWTKMEFWFEFEEGSDLNAISGREILSMGYSNGMASETFSRVLGGGNIGVLFGISNGIASLTVGDTGTRGGVLYCISTVLCPGRMQVGQGNFISMDIITESGDRISASAGDLMVSKTYYSKSFSQVPAPFTPALLLTGFVLLAWFRKLLKPTIATRSFI